MRLGSTVEGRLYPATVCKCNSSDVALFDSTTAARSSEFFRHLHALCIDKEKEARAATADLLSHSGAANNVGIILSRGRKRIPVV